jgi:hypothetical protein
VTKELRQRALLALLALVAVVFLWGKVTDRSPAQDRASVSPEGRSESVDAEFEVERLRLADLDLEPGEFEIGRDPFRFAAPPPAPPPKPAARQNQPPKRARANPQAQPNRGAANPQPPPVDVEYLGRFGPVDGPIAVFSDGREIFNVQQGGVLKEHFLVDKIGYESADLLFVGFPDVPAKRLAVGGKS